MQGWVQARQELRMNPCWAGGSDPRLWSQCLEYQVEVVLRGLVRGGVPVPVVKGVIPVGPAETALIWQPGMGVNFKVG